MVEREEKPSGPLDVPTLEVLAQRAATPSLVSNWEFRPDSLSPRALELRLNETRYPAAVSESHLDVRWFVGGDYTIQYLETREDRTWQCRWDRHPKPTAPREHYYPPPDASSPVESSSLESAHHLEVLFSVLEYIES